MECDGLWSVLPDSAYFLYALITEKKPENILELGSGVSTVVMAKAASTYGGRVNSLEHQLEFANATIDKCNRYSLTNAQIVHAHPICHCNGTDEVRPYAIYDPNEIPAAKYGFVFIDGPPGYPAGALGRGGTLFTIWKHLADNATVILDDAERRGETEIIMERMKFFGKALSVACHKLDRPVFFVNAQRSPDTGSRV